MNVKQIIEEYLKKNGYDGLYEDAGNCGCDIHDLMPCTGSGPFEECLPGYKAMQDDGDWIIQAKKPEVK